MTEIYKTIKRKSRTIMKNLFIFQENIHNIRNFEIVANEVYSGIWVENYML